MAATSSVGVARDSSNLAGKELVVGKSLKAYATSPKYSSGKQMGIIVVHDIFGFPLPNTKYIVDYLALKGFEAVMVDVYESQGVEPWPATETEVTKPLEGEDFGKFFGSISSEEYWTRFNQDMEEAQAFLKRKGCTKFGVIGFCWGGQAAEKAAQSGKFTAAVSVHGAGHTPEKYKEVKGSILYISVNDDPYFPKTAQDELKAAGAKLKIFEGVHHGFAVRGDFSDEKVKAAADAALSDASDHFSQACLRKPKYAKVGSLNPDSSGINLLVKVTSAVTEVEEPRRGGGATKFLEVTVGDQSGQVILSLKDFQAEGLTVGKVVALRNASVRMVKGHIRLVIDKWGKLDKEVEGTVEEVGSKNMSEIEYELVQA